MDDMLLRVIGCLLQVHHDHGPAAYHRAVRRALVAVCNVLIEEAGGAAMHRRSSGNVVRLPLRPDTRSDPKD